MTALGSSIGTPMNHTPSGPYRSIRPKNAVRAQRPFHVSAYRDSSAPPPSVGAGFPAAEPREVSPWIPGVTSPEGVVLATGLTAAMAGGGESIVRAAQFIASGFAVAVTAGFPGAAAFFASTGGGN